jgi:hypothetical protein
MEDRIISFYENASKQSQGLLADVPRAFKAVQKKRVERKLKLADLLDKEENAKL